MIADGAAFGSEMDKVMRLLKERKNAALYLPESFEWLILSSGVLKDNELKTILREPSDYIESSKYFSWERFFTSLLISRSKSTYLSYSKSVLNPSYLEESVMSAVVSQMAKIRINRKFVVCKKQ